MPRKRQSTKSRIVKAAWNLFHKKGYDQTTVEDIISASKTSKGTFYHYFKGKEALLNSLSYLFDEKYEELAGTIDPNLSASDKLFFLNRELFQMIKKRFYFKWLTEIIDDGIKSGEFKDTSTAEELMKIYALYERAIIYDWALFKGKYSLAEYSSKLLPHVLRTFVEGV